MTGTDYLQPEFVQKVPEGDDHKRSICTRCGFIDYQNPRIIVGSVASAGKKILLCKRAIEPRRGFWTLPAGFLELHERVEEGARREAREEAGAELTIDRLLACYSVLHISQVHLMYRATLENPETIKAGIESEEVQLFEWQDIPWKDLAFPSVYWALTQYKQVEGCKEFTPFSNPEEGL